MLHDNSNSAEQNVDGNGRLLLEAMMGLWEAQILCERSQWGPWENMEQQHLCFTKLSWEKMFWMYFIAGLWWNWDGTIECIQD